MGLRLSVSLNIRKRLHLSKDDLEKYDQDRINLNKKIIHILETLSTGVIIGIIVGPIILLIIVLFYILIKNVTKLKSKWWR